MTKSASNILCFIFGAAAGGLATWYFVKDIYRKKADMEVESVKRAYAPQEPETTPGPEDEEFPANRNFTIFQSELESMKTDYSEIIKSAQYDQELAETNGPYIIAPTEYGEDPTYKTYELTYFADGIITDEVNDPLDEEEIAKTIGRDAIEHFGEYEDDSVYVRNDVLKADYLILKDLRKFSYADDNIPGSHV